MSKIIIDATHTGELRVAVVDKNNKLIDLEIERESQKQKKANIYKGVISSIEPSLGAVFVNYGAERHGFLPIKDISREYYLSEPRYAEAQEPETTEPSEEPKADPVADNSVEKNTETEESKPVESTTDTTTTIKAETETTEEIKPYTANTAKEERKEEPANKTEPKSNHKRRSKGRNQTPINLEDILKVGQELVIQVEKEERGNKGAALTTYISLAGAYLVLMPNNASAGGVSRRIEGDDREQVRSSLQSMQIPENMGLIVRTAGVGKTTEELQWDLNILLQYWEAVKQAAVAETGPYLIHQESDAVIRAIRDYLRAGVEQIVINDKECFHRAHNYINRIRPAFASHLKYYDDTLPIFSHFQVEKQIEACYLREIRLPSGGSIVIDHTEALVSIDINSARATRGSDIEETALHTNLEAAQEIARQLRIRDIGGLVVIDFIDMTPTKNQREVENKLREALRMDRARIQIGKISRFGLLEMSRQRVGQSLRLASHITCPQCSGQGTIRSVESLSFSLLHIIQEQASKSSHQAFQLQLPVEVATYMINEKRQSLSQIELAHDAHITIIPNPHITTPHYSIKQTKFDPETSSRKQNASYKLLRQPKMQNKLTALAKDSGTREIPAVQKYIQHDAVINNNKKQPTGLFKQLWNKVLGIETSEKVSSYKVEEKNWENKQTPKARRNNNNNRSRNRNNQNNKNQNQKSSSNKQQNKSNNKTPANRNNKNQQNSGNKATTNMSKDKDRKTQNPKSRNRNQRNDKNRNPNKTKQEQKQWSDTGPSTTQQEKLAAAQLQNTINQMQQYTKESMQPNYYAADQANGNEKKPEAAQDNGGQKSGNRTNNRKPRGSGNRRNKNRNYNRKPRNTEGDNGNKAVESNVKETAKPRNTEGNKAVDSNSMKTAKLKPQENKE